MKKNQMPKLDEKRDLHPLVQRELERNGYDVQHEVKLSHGKVDFVARRGNSENGEILVVECKRDCKDLAQVCGQVRGYAMQIPSSRPMIAVPGDTLIEDAFAICAHFEVELIPIHVPHNVYALAYRASRPDVHDNRPLPLIVAERWGFPLQYHFIDGQYWYALQDWVSGLTQMQGSTLREQVRYLKEESTVRLNLTVAKYLANNGKNYDMPFANDESLYDVAQALRPLQNRKRLPEVHREILSYLAKAGVLVDVYRRNPERMLQDAINNMSSQGQPLDESSVRRELTDVIDELTGGKCGLYIAEFTNIINDGVLQKTASQQRGALELAKNKNPRDHMFLPGRWLIAIAEYMAAKELRERKPATLDGIRNILRSTAAVAGLGAQVMQAGYDTDMLTGRALPPFREPGNED